MAGVLLAVAVIGLAVWLNARGEPLDYQTYASRVSQTGDALDGLFATAENIHERQVWLLSAAEQEAVETRLRQFEGVFSRWSRARAPSELRDFHKTWRKGAERFAEIARGLSRYAATGDRDELASITATWEEAVMILSAVMEQAEELHEFGSQGS